MKLDTQPYKGTRDFYPEDLKVFRWMFLKIEKVLKLYGYEEYMGPLLESVELYKAKSGDNIVKEEMYTLKDRGDRDLAIRPELTPTLARMIANRIQTIPKPIRWYSIPNLYRDEKPQRSRLKEHWQLNVDILGVNSMYAEIEIFQIIKDIYDSFNIPQSSYKIRYNSLIYLRNAIKSGINRDPAILKAIEKIIDKKNKLNKEDFNKSLQDIGLDDNEVEYINKLMDTDIISVEGSEELKKFQSLLNTLGLANITVFDPTIVRGFDYYTNIVFEVFDTGKENIRSLFGGGRYNDLISIFNKGELPAVGFGMGDVPLYNFLKTYDLIPISIVQRKEILLGVIDDSALDYAIKLASQIRQEGIEVITYFPANKIDKILKYANTKGIPYLIIIGEQEMNRNSLTFKNLNNREQEEISDPRDLKRLIL